MYMPFTKKTKNNSVTEEVEPDGDNTECIYDIMKQIDATCEALRDYCFEAPRSDTPPLRHVTREGEADDCDELSEEDVQRIIARMKASADTTEVAVAQTSSVWDNMFE